jgi:hypothetical protein
MKQEVLNIIQDDSFNSSIAGYVNEAFLQASGRVNIPDLKRVGIATTVIGQMYTSLAGIPDGFSGRLTRLLDPNIVRHTNVESLLAHISVANRDITEINPVEDVALEGKTLWYFPTPSTPQSIQALMFSNPIIMTDDDNTPEAFPEICHRNIGVHGAAFMAFSMIEDGIEGDKVNTNHHFTMFEKGITQLTEWIGKHRPHQISSIFNDGGRATSDWGNSYLRWVPTGYQYAR